MADEHLSVAIRAARAAGSCLVRAFASGTSQVVSAKEGGDFETSADRQASEAIVQIVSKAFPEHDLLCEEADFRREAGSEHCWVVDSLDGTFWHHNGIPQFAVMIALCVAAEPVLGVIYEPYTDDLVYGSTGQGAWWTNERLGIRRPLRARPIDGLADALVAVNSGKDPASRRWAAALMDYLLPRARDVRRGGAGVDSSYLARGALSAVVNNSPFPWDHAAAIAPATEAGYLATDLDGRPWRTDGRGSLAAHAILHGELLELAADAD